MTLGIFYGLLTMFGFGISNALMKIPAEKLGGIKSVFLRGIFVCLAMAVAMFFVWDGNYPLKYVLLTFVLAFFSYVPILFFFKSLKVGKVGVVTPIANSSGVVTLLLALIFLKESLNFVQVVCLLMIVAGIIAISANPADWKKSNLANVSSGIPFALVACFCWGLMFFLFKFLITALGPWMVLFVIEIGIFLASALNLKLQKESIVVSSKLLVLIVLMSLVGVVGSVAYNFGLKVSNVSMIAIFYMSSPLVATLFAKFFFKEKMSKMQYMAACLIVFGIIGMSI